MLLSLELTSKPFLLCKASVPRSEKLLIQEVQNEVAARLKQSLHNQVFIHLEMQQNSEQVKRPWDSEIKIGDQPTEFLSETTEFCRYLIEQMLLVSF
jgi:hypothetical protein